jgi:hypothetical protein
MHVMSHEVAYRRRRGMLLLMVMLMLALFMAIGAMLLTIASRSRAAARANFVASQQSVSSDTICRNALDQALMAAIRGATSGTNGSVTVTGSTGTILENLLADKYGPSTTSITGTGVLLSNPAAGVIPANSGTGAPVMTISLTSLSQSGSTPSRLNGRVLTINPSQGAGDTASYRILGATGTSTSTTGTTTCYVAQMPSMVARRLPALDTPFPVVINGREFTPASGSTVPESYDAYDDANLWLAQPVLANGQVSGTYARLSFSGTSGTATVDNDNDGVLDGIWIPSDAVVDAVKGTATATPFPVVIPDQPSPLGGTLRFQVSYLILDLDGRINVNTAGMATAQAAYSGTPNTPIGMGYGPADINSPLLFPPALPTVSGTYPFSGVWRELLLSGTPTTTPAAPNSAQHRTPPVVGSIDGRYGSNSTPGSAGDETNVNQQTSGGTNAIVNLTTGGTASIYNLTIAGANAVADLKAQTRVYMTSPAAGQITPALNFYRPTWSGTAGSDSIDDPYESRLDTDAPRSGVTRRPTVTPGLNDDNPFTLAELERVLRPNDPDAPQLPQRLASGLEHLAQRSRMTITTDSWDTPGLTGLAARKIEDYIAVSGTSWGLASNVMSPDIAAGLRFNVNRPVLSGTSATAVAQQQEYCKGLYTLVMGLANGATGAPTAAEIAQWAANVLDFRDADSIMTRFAYDTDLSDGWQITASSPVVFGAERPEVVIVETAAWRDTANNRAQLFVNVHRPAASALLLTATTGTTFVTGTTELSPLAFSGTLPLTGWQLRFATNRAVAFTAVGTAGVTGTQSVLSGTTVVSSTTNLSGASLGPPSGMLETGSGAYLCVLPGSSGTFSASGIPTFTVDQGGAFQFTPSASSGTVALERLANPSLPNSDTNPYVVVDTAVVNSIQDVSHPSYNPANLTKNRRRGPQDTPANPLAIFWTRSPLASAWTPVSSTALTTYAVSGSAPAPWFHWPNRPFISQAELALVPTGSSSTDGVLATYSFPTNSLATSTVSVPVATTSDLLGSLILDATHVPSRFAENAVTIAGSLISVVGLDKLQANHFSKWREPGRVNVNTIISGTTILSGTTASLNDVVWTTLMGNTYVANPFIPKPAITSTIPAAAAVPGTADAPTIPAIPAIPVGPAQPATPAGSISQLLSLSGVAGLPIATGTFTTTSSTTIFPRDKNTFFPYAQAIRLANTATIRSNVFAVWITVRITDDSTNAPSPVTKRLFAIIDRSIPAGYQPNQDLNVRDTIKLKRYLD